jgi:(2Fe-2S) ferredoxin
MPHPKIYQSELKKHIFVCCNERADGTGCGKLGGNELRERLKQEVRGKMIEGVRVSKSGCLGYCEEGIAAVVYPDCVFITKLKKHDENVILKVIEEK